MKYVSILIHQCGPTCIYQLAISSGAGIQELFLNLSKLKWQLNSRVELGRSLRAEVSGTRVGMRGSYAQ